MPSLFGELEQSRIAHNMDKAEVGMRHPDEQLEIERNYLTFAASPEYV
jgi:hypothetical protein